MPYKITPTMLEGRDLCDYNLKKFKRLYPRGLYVTEENCLMLLIRKRFSASDLYFVGAAFLSSYESGRLWEGRYDWDKERFAKAFVKYWNRYKARLKFKRGGK